jgi:hypothetical protein
MSYGGNKCRAGIGGLLLLGILSVGLLGGCPIDTDELAISVTEAALNSVTDSIVDSLATHVAGG